MTASAAKDRPFGRYERSLAFRYIRAKREHGGVAIVSLLSLLGVTLAVAALIIVMSIMNGFQSELIDRVLGNSGHIRLYSAAYSSLEINELERNLKTKDEVVSVTPIVEGAVLASANGRADGAFVRGMRTEDAFSLPYLQGPLFNGGIAGFGDGRFGGKGVFVSERLARQMGTFAGSDITLIAPEGASTVGGIVPRKKTYEVLGVFEIFAGNANPLDDVLIIMPLEQSQLFFNSRDTYPIVELKVREPRNVHEVARDLVDNELPIGMPVTTWKEMYRGIVGALQVERSMMRLIFAVLITITALNIITGIVMLVKNKSRDVAILRTMGASRSSIMRVFLMVGIILGLTGMSLGLSAGLLFCFYIQPIQDFLNMLTGNAIWNPDVYGLPYIPAQIDWSEVGFACVYAVAVSILVSLLPSWNAARLDPVDALRAE